MEELKRKGSFWPSYVDIMTTLFAIVLVLFVVSYSRFKIKENDYNISVSTYVEAEDTREEIDINELNEKIAKIVEKENWLREEIDRIIKENFSS